MKNTKGKTNVADTIINIVVVIILVFTFILTLNILLSNGKGYVSIFGTAAIAVKTDSMNGDQVDSFKQGDLIFVKVLVGAEHDQERQQIKEGNIVTYYSADVDGDGQQDIISHRVVGREVGQDGTVMNLLVKGDNPAAVNTTKISTSAVIGVYSGKIGGLGNFSLFVQKPIGFGVIVVLPSILIVVYCVYVVIKNVKEVKGVSEKASLTDAEKEKIRAEILAEMKNDNKDENK